MKKRFFLIIMTAGAAAPLAHANVGDTLDLRSFGGYGSLTQSSSPVYSSQKYSGGFYTYSNSIELYSGASYSGGSNLGFYSFFSPLRQPPKREMDNPCSLFPCRRKKNRGHSDSIWLLRPSVLEDQGSQ